MRLQRYVLNESLGSYEWLNDIDLRTGIDSVVDEFVDGVIELVKRDCKPFLKEVKNKNNLFYRGSDKISDKNVLRIKPRNNRKPLNTPEILHDFMDEYFKKRFGWKPRSEGVFVTKNPYPYIFGITTLFFPIGNYKYIWIKSVKDIFIEMCDISGDMFHTRSLNHLTKFEVTELFKRLEDVTFIRSRNKNLWDVKKEEVLFKCKEYYMVKVSNLEVQIRIEDKLWK